MVMGRIETFKELWTEHRPHLKTMDADEMLDWLDEYMEVLVQVKTDSDKRVFYLDCEEITKTSALSLRGLVQLAAAKQEEVNSSE